MKEIEIKWCPTKEIVVTTDVVVVVAANIIIVTAAIVVIVAAVVIVVTAAVILVIVAVVAKTVLSETVQKQLPPSRLQKNYLYIVLPQHCFIVRGHVRPFSRL